MFGKILIADEDANYREFFYEIFTQANYNVTTLPSGREIPELLKKERPNYIILCPPSPCAKGMDVLKKIREIDKNIRVLLLTAEDPEDMQKQFAADDRTVFLKKDPDRLKLMNSVFNILKEKEIERIDEGPAAIKGKIMVIDDEQEVNGLISNYLEKKGYDVTSVYSGEEALIKIKVNKPQVVILDIRMKGLDGMLILKRVKDIDKSVVVIMTSGIGDEEIIAEAMKMGAAGYLVKPFNLTKLEACILANTLLGESKGFTLIELMVAFSILSIGIVFILRSFLGGAAALNSSQNRIDAIGFLEAKMNEFEEAAKREKDIALVESQGQTEINNRNATWNSQINTVEPQETEVVAPEGQKKELTEVRLSLLWQETGRAKDEILVTYFENKKE